jgi:hypothetical protein
MDIQPLDTVPFYDKNVSMENASFIETAWTIPPEHTPVQVSFIILGISEDLLPMRSVLTHGRTQFCTKYLESTICTLHLDFDKTNAHRCFWMRRGTPTRNPKWVRSCLSVIAQYYTCTFVSVGFPGYM